MSITKPAPLRPSAGTTKPVRAEPVEACDHKPRDAQNPKASSVSTRLYPSTSSGRTALKRLRDAQNPKASSVSTRLCPSTGSGRTALKRLRDAQNPKASLACVRLCPSTGSGRTVLAIAFGITGNAGRTDLFTNLRNNKNSGIPNV